MNLTEEFAKREPWYTKFEIAGSSYGGDYDAMNDPRLAAFEKYFPEARTILELGSLEGGHSFGLARMPNVEKVTAIEVRPANIERARFVGQTLGVENVEFIEADLEKTDLASFGKFDAVFCSGLLYHLPEPWKLIEQIARVSPNLFLWTHISGEIEGKKKVNGFRGKYYKEHGWLDSLSGASKNSFWLTLGSLIHLLTANGYRQVHIIENYTHANGQAVLLAARRDK